MQRVIIVDISNLRERAPGKEKVEHQDYKGRVRRITLAEWSYIYDGVTHLAAKAPGSAIYLVADKSTRYHFANKPQGMRVFDANSKLPCEEFWHMYAMPTRKEVGSWLGGSDGDEGVEADELILYLAAQLDGFVITGDFLREEKYQVNLHKIQHRVYWPARALDESDWHFVDSRQIRNVPEKQRFNIMHTIPNLQSALEGLPLLDRSQINKIRNSICETGGLIDRFWLEYRLTREVTSSDTATEQPRAPIPPSPIEPMSKPEPVEVIRMPEPEPSPVESVGERHRPKFRRPKPVVRTSTTRSLGDVIKENIGILPPTNDGVDEDAKIPLVLAYQSEAMSRHIDRAVRVIGRLRQHHGKTFLEWFPGDLRVCVKDWTPRSSEISDGFVGIVGRVSKRGTALLLETARSSEIRSYQFVDIVDLVTDQTTIPTLSDQRRWSLPRLPGWRRAVAAVRKAEQPKPLPPAVPKPKPPVPLPPEPSRLNPRLVTSIALAAAIVAALAGLVRSLIG